MKQMHKQDEGESREARKKTTNVLVPLFSGSSVFRHRWVYGGQVVWRSAELGDSCLLQFRPDPTRNKPTAEWRTFGALPEWVPGPSAGRTWLCSLSLGSPLTPPPLELPQFLHPGEAEVLAEVTVVSLKCVGSRASSHCAETGVWTCLRTFKAC